MNCPYGPYAQKIGKALNQGHLGPRDRANRQAFTALSTETGEILSRANVSAAAMSGLHTACYNPQFVSTASPAGLGSWIFDFLMVGEALRDRWAGWQVVFPRGPLEPPPRATRSPGCKPFSL